MWKKLQFHANKEVIIYRSAKDLDDVWSCKLSLFTERPPPAKNPNNETFPRNKKNSIFFGYV